MSGDQQPGGAPDGPLERLEVEPPVGRNAHAGDLQAPGLEDAQGPHDGVVLQRRGDHVAAAARASLDGQVEGFRPVLCEDDLVELGDGKELG